ncbi:MAG: hypothetical protein ACI4SE_01265 [Lachnospiraceae bacterium]
MSSKEDYLDSLLNSVMQDSDQNEKLETGEDVTALLDTMSDDGELAEINDLLKQSEQSSSTSLADDMLALLEQADAKDRENESEEAKKTDAAEQENSPFDFFADENPEEENNGETDTADEQPHADRTYPVNEMTSANEQDAAIGTVMDGSDMNNSAGWEELLEPAESKAEQKARKKREKQEEQARRKEEKAKSKEEKSKAKKEKASQKQEEENSDIESMDAETETAETEKPKKSGFFARLFGGLLEEVPEQEELQEIDLSDENKAILEEVGKEEIVPKKDKKKGKKDKKKGKKSENEQSSEESEEGGQDDKKSKKEAKKKEKKEKKAKKAEEAEFLREPTKKLPRKKVISIFAICLTFMAIIVITSLIVPSYLDKKEARKAYYNGDYEEVYHLFSGEKLSGSDAILYERSILVLYLDNKLDAYHLHMTMGEEKEALNELFTAVAFYQKNLEHATECGAIEEMQPRYGEILKLLQDSYQVSEERAVEIAQMESLDYNKALYQILYGTEFTIPEMQPEVSVNGDPADIRTSDQMQAEEVQETVPEDVLPEEEELLQQDSSVMIDQDQQTVSQDAETIPQEGQTMSQDAQTGEEAAEDENLLYSGTVQNGQAIVQ